ncbi:histidine kinase [Ramlibacter tataouinensis]|uniref:sensor histidine kinase n=1 Tax=Ramlibacter tataouinensis TaxID=94132 RepID=UPI0022F3D58D|nr:histidine kinase [Ramlibacter tataouinensis]WBY01434.1 histidine kinase [Ramlibacter tataouinensis]
MKLDGVAKLQHLLQAVAFCLAVAAVQVGFNPDQSWGPPLVYSLCIGLIVWAIVDLGRHLLPSAQDTGWPTGAAGLVLVAGGIVAGFLLGTLLADQLCRAWGLYGPGPLPSRSHALRSSVLVTLVASVTGCYYFYSRARSAWLEHRMGEVERQADDARLKLLETQLEPHMLFNTLANLRALIGVDPQRAQQMLDHMIAYLRSTLDASRATTHPLQAEFDRLRDYLELMAIRMGPRLSYRLALPAELAQRPVPTLLLQPLVENAIRHGLEPQVAGGRLEVSARQEGAELVLEVLDTGVGPAAASTPGSGFGLTQVRERLATLYGAAGRVQLQAAQPQGTLVSVRLPAAAA